MDSRRIPHEPRQHRSGITLFRELRRYAPTSGALNDSVDDTQHSDRECLWLRYDRVDLNGGVVGRAPGSAAYALLWV